MILYSRHTGIVASSAPMGVQLEWPSGERANLTGEFASEFLGMFQGATASAPRLEALAAVGSVVHQRILESARIGDGAQWVPLTAQLQQPLLFLELLGRCNERCVHCYAESAPEVTAELSLETARRVIADGRSLGFEHLQLTGGDPLLSPHVVALAHEGRRAGYALVEVYTNGLALTDERADALAEAGVAFAFSFYSHDPKKHDAITRVPGSQVRTLQAMGRALQRGLRVRAGIISFGPDPEELERTVRVLVDAGIPPERIGVDQVRLVGRGNAVAASNEAAEAFHADGPTHGGTERSTELRWPGKLAVAYTGHVHPCIFTRWASLGNVRDESLVDIVARVRTRRAQLPVTTATALPSKLACSDCQLTARAMMDWT